MPAVTSPPPAKAPSPQAQPTLTPPPRIAAQTPVVTTPSARPRRASRHNPKEAFKTFAMMIGGSIPVWFLTPVVASFATLFMPNLSSAVFAADENNGRTAGDSPDTLYTHLAWVLVAFCAAILAMNLVFGTGTRYMWLLTLAFIGGVVAFVWQVISAGGALWQWDILPAALASAYLIAQLLTTLTSPRKP